MLIFFILSTSVLEKYSRVGRVAKDSTSDFYLRDNKEEVIEE